MLSVDRRKRTNPEGQGSATPSPTPGPIHQYSPVANQQSFSHLAAASFEDMPAVSPIPTAQPLSAPVVPQMGIGSSLPVVTGTLADTSLTSPATGTLGVVETGKLSSISDPRTTSLRRAVVIRGTSKKSSGTLLPPKPQGKRLAVHLAVGISLLCILVGALLAVVPTGADGHGASAFQSLFMNGINSKGNNTSSIAALAATATAVTQDGYDPGNAAMSSYAGVQQVALSGAAGDNFAAGQCTYWADYRYHQLTGHYVPWSGNAYQWYAGALADGWDTSTTPHIPSIVVLAPGVQGASAYYGHVAVAESMNADGSVRTSDWNWAGNWGVTTYVNFTPGSGVHFVWYPGF